MQDAEGNYVPYKDDLIGGRYCVLARLGEGSYGQVFRAVDTLAGHDADDDPLDAPKEVAVKVLNSRADFAHVAEREVCMLAELRRTGTPGVVTVLDWFMWHGHPCIVFELLCANLHELLRNTAYQGVSLRLTRLIGRQILATLQALVERDTPIAHCDLKPDNIMLCHPRRSTIKIVDFGSACTSRDVIPSYVQTRLYRAAEAILDVASTRIDMFSLACVLFELHTGHTLFSSTSSQDHLHQIVDLVGLPPPDLLNVIPPHVRAMYFASPSPKGHWTLRGGGDVSCGAKRTHAEVCAALQNRLRAHGLGDTGRRRADDDHGPDDYARFVDLLARLLHADPTQRLSPRAALCHPFVVHEKASAAKPTASAAKPTASASVLLA